MKQKPARRGVEKKKRAIPSMPLTELKMGAFPGPLVGGFFGPDGDGNLPANVATRRFIEGVPLPSDVESLFERTAKRERDSLQTMFTVPPWDRNDEAWPDCVAHWLEHGGDDRAGWDWTPATIGSEKWEWIEAALQDCIRNGFYLALLRYADDLKHVPEAMALLKQRKENGELLAAEGRAAKAVNDRCRADLICRLYKAARPSFPDGRRGNGLAHRAVAERYEMQTGESVTERTVRDTVKKAGLSAPWRRKGKN